MISERVSWRRDQDFFVAVSNRSKRPHKFKVVGLQVSVLTHHRTQPMGISNEYYVEQYKKILSKGYVRRLISSPRNILNCP